MRPCPLCGGSVSADKTICPDCGASVPTVWPPQPDGPMPPPAPSAGKLVTGHPNGDFALGMVLSVASLFLACLGVLVMPLLYLAISRSYPAFARGIGWGWVLIVLGTTAVCFSPPIWHRWLGL